MEDLNMSEAAPELAERIYTTSAALRLPQDWLDYLEPYRGFYNMVKRRVYHDIRTGFMDTFDTETEYRKHIQEKFRILKRTANSIIKDVQGLVKAYKELKKTELKQLNEKISAVALKIKSREEFIAKNREEASTNRLSSKKLKQYQQYRRDLYFLRNKLNRLAQKRDKLSDQIHSGRVSICFGTRELFRKQHNLAANNYSSHARWRNDFIRKRDSGIYFIGSGDETGGNQLCHLKPESEGTFTLYLLKDLPFRKDKTARSKRLVLENVRIPYLHRELAEAIANGKPVSARIIRAGKRWRLYLSFSKAVGITTSLYCGVIGSDYNDGHMEIVETDSSGNMVYAEHVPLDHHGQGDAGLNELRQKVHDIVERAAAAGKDIAIEDLDFWKEKARMLPGKGAQGKAYNKMLHDFDCARYKQTFIDACAKSGVKLRIVNPAYTTQIGEDKYMKQRKLTVHRSAALVIARRGQGFTENWQVPVKKTAKAA